MAIAPDKRAHAWSGAGLALALLAVIGLPAACMNGRTGFLLALAACFLAVLAVAVGKEVMDAQDPEHHTCDPWDAVATMAGALAVLLPALLVALLKG